MFNRDQSAIGAYARTNADNMKRVYWFVIATVQQPLWGVPEILADFEVNGAKSKHLWAWKGEAFDNATDNAQEIYESAMTLWETAETEQDASDMLLAFFAGQKGLGLAKGGFMVQLCFGLSGCIDSHNVARFGYNKSAFSAARFKKAKTKATRDKVIATYQELVEKSGGCRNLWNDWCDYVASRQPERYANGDEVSRVHCEALGIA